MNSILKPSIIPSIDAFKDDYGNLIDLSEIIHTFDENKQPITTHDWNRFKTGTRNEEIHNKLIDLLFGVDIIEGNLICLDCDGKNEIKDGILFC